MNPFEPTSYRSFSSLAVSALVVGLFLVLPAACGDTDDESAVESVQQAVHVDPVVISGNPSCADAGSGDFELKIKPESGTYAIDSVNSVTVTVDSGSRTFDWTSTLSLDGVVVKGGPSAHFYEYDPEASADTGLSAPLNSKNGKLYGLSHISFCYDYELDVAKTASTSFTRTYGWTIDKAVSPSSWSLFTGDDATSDYTITLTKDAGTDSDWAADGSISIENNTPFDATIESVSDTISPGISASVDCGVSFPHTLGSLSTLTCSYSSSLPDGTDRTNTATVETSGTVGGNSDTVDVLFGSATITKVNDSVTVGDTNGSSWTMSSSGTQTYSRTFACDGDEGSHGNTATIRETGQSDSASVSITCWTLTVNKTADPSLVRTYQWDIDKSVNSVTPGDPSASPPQLIIPAEDPSGFGQGTAGYTVELTKTGSVDSDWKVTGSITIANDHPDRAAALTGVTDLVSPDIGASVSCPAASVPAAGSMTCTYVATVPDAQSRTNTATATLQNSSFDSSGNPTASGTTDFSGSAPVDFTTAVITEVDASVNITDVLAGFPTLNFGPFTGSSTFSYDRTYTCPGDDGEHTNTATIVETGASDDAVVDVVCQPYPSDEGCTPGFWQGGTGSELWDSSNDPDWASHCGGGSSNPYTHATLFNDFFTPHPNLAGETMFDQIRTGGSSDPVQKAARSLVAAYLNASCDGVSYKYSTAELEAMWDDAIAGDRTFGGLHSELDLANNAGCDF